MSRRWSPSPLSVSIATIMFSVLSVDHLAHADPPEQVRFAWVRGDGADGCSDGVVIAREVARRLGRDPFAAEAHTSLEAMVTRDGARWQARLYLRDEDGRHVEAREFTSEAPACDSITRAVAMAAALLIDPEAAANPPPLPPPPPPPPVRSTPPVTSPPPPAAPPPWWRPLGATLRAVGGVGLLPAFSPGVAIGAEGPLTARLRWSSGVMVLPSVTTETSTVSASFGTSALWLSGCFASPFGSRVSLSACAGLLGGPMHFSVRRGNPEVASDPWWIGAALGARVRVRTFGAFVIEPGVDLVAPFVRPRFVVAGQEPPVFQSASLAVLFTLGVGIHAR